MAYLARVALRVVIIASGLIAAGGAVADNAVLPFTHSSPPLDHASVVGSHLDIHTVITPTPSGFTVHVRFSNGDNHNGQDMCSRTYFRSADRRLIATSVEYQGISTLGIGNGTNVVGGDKNVPMDSTRQAVVALVEIEQFAGADNCRSAPKQE